MATTTEMHLPSSAEESGRSHRFNYLGMHRYLITLAAFKPTSVFTGREVVLSVLDALRETSRNHHFDVYAYSFLPDQLTLIVRGKEQTSDMKQFLTAFRHISSDRLHERLGYPLWKKIYTERVLRKKEDTKEVAREIFMGPVRAGLAPSAVDYEFQGSFVTNLAKTLAGSGVHGWKQQHSPSRIPPDTHDRRWHFQKGNNEKGKP